MNRVVKYDALRILASFAIVLLHVSASYWSVVDMHGTEFAVMTFCNSLTRFAVPVFFMLSGLFLVSPRRENVAVGKKVLKLILLFYVWSAFYAFQGAAVDAITGNFSMEVWNAAVERFIFGHVHMWFLQMLAGFYILIPIARQICAKKESVQYYIIIWAVFRFLIPTITNVFGLTTIQARIDSLGLDVLVGNFGYFLLGYYLNEIEIEKKYRRFIYILGSISVGLTVFLTIWDSRKTDSYVEKWFSPASLNILIVSVAIFVCFKYSKRFDNVKNMQTWGKISGYTFFIYMFHMFIIEKLNLIGITTISFPAIISIPVLTVVTFLGSLLCAFIADHIPGIRKIVMLH